MPYGSTQAAPPHVRGHRRPSIVGPLILIVVGGVFLLENAGMLPRNTWQSLWRLWPVVLVLVGLELLVGQRIPWVTLLGLAIVVLALGVAASTYTGFQGPAGAETRGRTIETALDGARQAAVTVRFGAGELKVGPMASGEPNRLASMTYDGPEAEGLRPIYTVHGDTGRLEYRLDGWRGGPPNFGPFFGTNPNNTRMEVSLNRDVPISTLTVQGGAADAELDLRELRVTNLDLAIGAATTEVRLPSSIRTVHVSGGAATITLHVPDNLAASITHRGGLSALEVNENRFPPAASNRYQSPNYDQATERVDIQLETGVTSIEID
jgi:hypothetical protein